MMAYSIQKADLSTHKGCLQDLWQRNFEGVESKRYEWIYENNPGGEPIVFLLKHDEKDSFVGAISMFPRTVHALDKKIKAYICGDMVVDVQHRALGPAVKLLKAAINHCQQEEQCLLISFPNQKSGPVTLRVGFKVLANVTQMTRVIRTEAYLKRQFKSKMLTRLLSLPTDWLMQLRYDASLLFKQLNYSCEIKNSFDESFDALLIEQSKNYSFVGSRTVKYLNWRINQSPYKKYQTFVVRSKKQQRISGYIAFSINDNRVEIIDFASDGQTETIQVLFHLFLKYQKTQKCDAVSLAFAGGSGLINLLKRRGFSVRDESGQVVVFSSSATLNPVQLIDNSNWYLTAVDNDI